ncbi:MAG: sigma-70 family RNA polymerase sigma factor [Verrucomicrobia bacterium]|nr:sigma-70 family RNA polymerase sigma factor [Verrucomicrobiota bacterium]
MSEALKQVTTEFLASRPQLMAFIYGLVRHPQTAEDIYQDVWLKLAGALENGTVIENQTNWCRAVAKNLILQHWREQRVAKVVADSTLLEFVDYVELAFAEADPSKDRWPDRQYALNQCVDALPEKSKRLLLLKYEEGFSIGVIASHLRQSTAAVIKALVRLREALALCVEKKLKLQELGL